MALEMLKIDGYLYRWLDHIPFLPLVLNLFLAPCWKDQGKGKNNEERVGSIATGNVFVYLSIKFCPSNFQLPKIFCMETAWQEV